MTNLLIADDHPLYRDALKVSLSLAFSELTIFELQLEPPVR
jgi:DNA-binding NarL/FixJ family response regulator